MSAVLTAQAGGSTEFEPCSIKINKKLEESGWRFEVDNSGPANIKLKAGHEHQRAELENNYGK